MNQNKKNQKVDPRDQNRRPDVDRKEAPMGRSQESSREAGGRSDIKGSSGGGRSSSSDTSRGHEKGR